MAPKSTQHKFYADAWQAALKPPTTPHLLPLIPTLLCYPLSATPSLPPSTSPAQRHQL